MDHPMPQPLRERLAAEHRQALNDAPDRTGRQRMRRQLLYLWSRRYPQTGAKLPSSPKRILVVRPDHLGDLLFTTPALRLLRTQYPGAKITGLVGPWGRPVLEDNNDLDRLIVCAFPGFTRQPKGSLIDPYKLLFEEAERMSDLGFDLAFILRFDHWWGAWLTAAAGIPFRIGYDCPEVAPFLTHPIPYSHGRHEVVQNLALVDAAGPAPGQADSPTVPPGAWPLHFPISAKHDQQARALFASLDSTRPVVAIHPGSGAEIKHWRTGAWASLVAKLQQQHDIQVLFTGSAVETDLIDAILQQVPPALQGQLPHSLAGQTDLQSLAAIYRRCRLVIGPDSGPLHLAVAAGTPTIHLYGPVDKKTFGPWGNSQRHRVVTSDWGCIPCNRLDWRPHQLPDHGCVRDITVEQVMAEASRLLLSPN
ncbi:MAG: glycosyltransferase family 9 protein [Chloroflexota bacterium]|nr:glycosyltransferase family 9 protein [Chloroflexota bacterium]